MSDDFLKPNTKGTEFMKEVDALMDPNAKEGQSSIEFSTNTKGYVSWSIKVYRGDSEEKLTELRDKAFKLMLDVKAKADQINITKE